MKFKEGDHLKGNSGKERYGYVIDAEVVKAEPDDYDGELDILVRYLRFSDGNTKNVGHEYWERSIDFDYVDSYSPVSGTVASFMINGSEYTNEQFAKDCERFVREFPNDMNIELPWSMKVILIVYKWAQENPVVTNLDHYAEEFGWTEEQKSCYKYFCPLPYKGMGYRYCPGESSGEHILCAKCREWWKQEWKGGKS